MSRARGDGSRTSGSARVPKAAPKASGTGRASGASAASRASRADSAKAQPSKKAAARKTPAQPGRAGQPVKKAAPKKTAAPRRAEGSSATAPTRAAPAQNRPATVAERMAAAKKRAAAQQRARTVAAGSLVSHAPHKSRTRTTATRSGGLRPASTRPGSARPRPGASGRGTRKRGFGAGSGRPVWVLGAVGVVLALLILPYFQKWLVQRSELESMRNEVDQAGQDVADLRRQQERWKDDDYVRAQARVRLNYVMPGETGLVVADPTPTPQPSATDPARTDVPSGDRSWFSDIWLSAEAAGSQGEAQATTVVP
ncbi:hypothetical protein Kisp01_16580 [Kineosporia sp. NBRC 101677]|uniref:FtsB family cell division protein n=1 Tax=Kineosporia sp. NBRC 101677 TaxID=3032197 RepID=UPI0024A1ED4F|nr:septum formation initiator family protein [Kineosporia sp. NBRC 101677]GLY14643.1 hypothetical protein Kisp01_16580 [Kineosporia sp. NBRC 101677]